MRDRAWFGLEARLRTLKQRYEFPGVPFELHVKQFAGSIKEQDQIPRFDQLSRAERRESVLTLQAEKLSKETNKKKRKDRADRQREVAPYVHLTRAERSELLNEAIEIVATHESLKIFAEAICKSHPAIQNGSSNPVFQAFEQVVSRFDTFLKKIDARNRDVSPRRSADCGLLILDHDASTESAIESLFRSFRDHGHSFGELAHVIDVPFFASSEKVSGLQFADVCAYVIRRYLDKGAVAGSHEEGQFRRLLPKFDRDSYGRLHGVRHYVPAGTCRCLICCERGHGGESGGR